jgi:hypothetical protein
VRSESTATTIHSDLPGVDDAPSVGAVTGLLSDPARMLTTAEAALVLGIRKQTLDAWRCLKRGGPPFIKFCHVVRYRAGDVAKYLTEHTVGQEGGAQ